MYNFGLTIIEFRAEPYWESLGYAVEDCTAVRLSHHKYKILVKKYFSFGHKYCDIAEAYWNHATVNPCHNQS